MLAWIESLPFLWAVLFFWAVGIVRTSIVFGLGRAAAEGSRRSMGFVQRVIESPAYIRAAGFVNRWGVLAVPACFLTVGFQTAVILTTALTRMPLTRWIPAMLVGTFLWGCIYGTVGMAVVRAWLANPVITAAVVVTLALAGVVVHLVTRDRSNAAPEDT
ncbi:hypothetical protein EDL96_10545 [Kocuria soli]|uniref:Uncharacterized protein n=1 Tax=Kocuria soli TaxID=2485125 RepID=A0A3N3ZRI0_9MICC|nr:hypothetical protein [Kocuria soli]ROZ62347.1 hypothetical protein EDL96_10545 [Kocuria soli]